MPTNIFRKSDPYFSVGRTSPSDLLEIEGLVTRGSRAGRSAGYLVGGIFALNGYDWSSGLRVHNFDTKPDTEFKQWVP